MMCEHLAEYTNSQDRVDWCTHGRMEDHFKAERFPGFAVEGGSELQSGEVGEYDPQSNGAHWVATE